MKHQAMLETVGARVRALREKAKFSRRELCDRSGISERFLAQLENGKGNISLSRLADVCESLATTPALLLHGISSGKKRDFIALLGLKGAGKSSIGIRLAQQRGVPFIELDALIEQKSGKTLSEIFKNHGKKYYRTVEREVLSRVLSEYSAAIIATGGSIVVHRENFSMLRNAACTIWLKARPQDHWNRVVEQEIVFPANDTPKAYSKMKTILASRESLYANSNYVVNTSGKNVDQVLALVMSAISEKL